MQIHTRNNQLRSHDHDRLPAISNFGAPNRKSKESSSGASSELIRDPSTLVQSSHFHSGTKLIVLPSIVSSQS